MTCIRRAVLHIRPLQMCIRDSTNAKIWGDPGTTYSYDKDGNLIQECDKTNSADPVTYEYTAENRLAVVKPVSYTHLYHPVSKK